MQMRNLIFVASLLFAFATGCAPSQSSTLKPYPLPRAAQQTIEELAVTSDVLILGEIHGTQEVPEVAATLLAPLTKQGYQILALEVPADQQTAITAWATGKTDTVPAFYAKPITDGRGNEQMLSLIRIALSPPYGWKLICFDQSDAEEQKQVERLKQKVGEETLKNPPASLSQGVVPDWMLAVWQQRDAAMASNFDAQFQQLGTQAKVLAICGDTHATTKHSDTKNPANLSATSDPPNPFWPSFAANVQSSHPAWRVNSIDVRLHGGSYFNAGQVNHVTFGGKPIDQVSAQPLEHGFWNLALDLPVATPATFLSTPADPDETPTPTTAKDPASNRSNIAPENKHP